MHMCRVAMCRHIGAATCQRSSIAGDVCPKLIISDADRLSDHCHLGNGLINPIDPMLSVLTGQAGLVLKRDGLGLYAQSRFFPTQVPEGNRAANLPVAQATLADLESSNEVLLASR